MGIIKTLEENGYIFEKMPYLVSLSKLHGINCRHGSNNPKGILLTKDKIMFNDGNISVTGYDIYKDFYSLTNEEFEDMLYNYSTQAKEKIKETRENIHCIKSEYTDDYKAISNIELLDIFTNSSEVIIGYSHDDKLWCAQYSYKQGDDYCIQCHYFTQKPTKDEIIKAHKLKMIESDLIMNNFNEHFICYNCGYTSFWLDLDEDIVKCYEMAKEHYCGC